MHDCIYDNQRAILIQYICNKCNRFNHLISNKQQNQSKMKNLFAFLTKIATLMIVVIVTFVSPAAIIGAVMLDLSLYVDCVTSPTYCALMFFITLFTCIYYVDWVIAREKVKRERA